MNKAEFEIFNKDFESSSFIKSVSIHTYSKGITLITFECNPNNKMENWRYTLIGNEVKIYGVANGKEGYHTFDRKSIRSISIEKDPVKSFGGVKVDFSIPGKPRVKKG